MINKTDRRLTFSNISSSCGLYFYSGMSRGWVGGVVGVGGGQIGRRTEQHSCWHFQSAVLRPAKLLIFFAVFLAMAELQNVKNRRLRFWEHRLGRACLMWGNKPVGKYSAQQWTAVRRVGVLTKIVTHDLAPPEGTTSSSRQRVAFPFVCVCVFTSVGIAHSTRPHKISSC